MNRLKVNLQQSKQVLAARGWSRRRIARELHVDRAAVEAGLTGKRIHQGLREQGFAVATVR